MAWLGRKYKQKSKMIGGVAEVIECLPSKHKVFSSIPTNAFLQKSVNC
jgi:hypothetical protein